jgi:hypothetical protein
MPNSNALVLEEIVEEENFEDSKDFEQEPNIIQDENLESLQNDEGKSSFYIYNE